jgi:hypothetical protein
MVHHGVKKTKQMKERSDHALKTLKNQDPHFKLDGISLA